MPLNSRVYLDHAATTPVVPAARAAMAEALARWANPSSQHAEGRAARALLEDARARIAAALGWTGEVVFTSGATEAAQLAFRMCWHRGPKPIVSTVEHQAVLRQAPESERLNAPVGADGIVDPEALAQLLHLCPGGLVAIQHCNSETGVIQPIAHILEAVDANGGTLFADCAQTAGKLPLPPADLIAVSAHKLGGPPGIGALLVRDPRRTLLFQGGQEGGWRPGTENLPAVLGFAAALEEAVGTPWISEQLANRVSLEAAIESAGGATICADSDRTPLIGAYHMHGMSAAAQLARFDLMGFSVSAGSACTAGSTRQSHVLAALGLDADASARTIRVSFGRSTTRAEVDAFEQAWVGLATEARRRAA